MNEQIEAIRNEIKRLQEIHERNLKKPMERGRIGYAHGVVACCDRFLSFIDSLPEEPNKSLEDAAEKYTDSSEWLIGENLEHIDAAFIAGASWQKEQMLKDAVEAEVQYFGETQGVPRTIKIPRMQEWLKPFKDGDKVRVIIVKEDER